ncbi:diphthamide biosynthesis protein-like protein 4 [Teratosphaeria destructans]|uniref:Diphthamide biosynthesis protein 4 n=1 Tax=Teratosphaeria destructans TaxID=418781 RepID=A0A9W7SZ64_9PEZI|nr:diphthamide biosynthesis protein-like protein 4 [Teratosphaeria destructans]
MPDHYEILGLESRRFARDLSVQEIKNAYKRALLQHHPDKGISSTHESAPPEPRILTVDTITLAYKTLSTPSSRSAYDRELLQRLAVETGTSNAGRVHRTGLETVDLDSLDFDDETGIWSRSCRCGDGNGFIVTEAELEKNAEEGELTVGCKGCSLWLKVLFGVDEG